MHVTPFSVPSRCVEGLFSVEAFDLANQRGPVGQLTLTEGLDRETRELGSTRS